MAMASFNVQKLARMTSTGPAITSQTIGKRHQGRG